jgi:hypothetical protein
MSSLQAAISRSLRMDRAQHIGSAYVARFHYIDQKQTSKLPQSFGDLISYATAVSDEHSNAGKYRFANETTDGKTPVSPDEVALLKEIGNVEDVLAKPTGSQQGARGPCIWQFAPLSNRAERHSI